MCTARKNRTDARHCLIVGVGLAIGIVLTNAAFAAPAPDGSGTPVRPAAPDQTGASYSYLWLPATTFIPFGAGAQIAYNGGGCISGIDGGTERRILHKVILPSGATVKYVRLYTYDASSDSILAFFTTYDAAGNFNQRNTVSSADHAGYGEDLGAEMTYVVDQFAEPINMVINLGNQHAPAADTIFANGFDVPSEPYPLRFCGVRIAYFAP